MKDCRRLRQLVSQNAPVPAELEQHLFACPACRRFVRSEQILSLLHESREGPASVPPDFVERVMLGLAEKKERPKTASGLKVMRWAAVLLFSIAAGYGFSVSTDVAKSVEWTASVTIVPSPIISTETFGLPNDSSPS
jgi:predicted anti-sigma-YlaC factor YlaD